MEIKMVRCPNGHYYNAALHVSCPECGKSAANAGVRTEPGPGPESYGKTEPAGAGSGAGAAYGATEPVGGAGYGKTEPAGGSHYGATEPVGGSGYGLDTIDVGSDRAGADPFGVTMIGGESLMGRPEPVVGWLVCIDGLSKGVDYRLHAGYNYIGREEGDIHIHGDMQISRRNHAMVAYDSSERTYYVGPSAGRNLIKVNGKTVLNAAEIKSYDVVSIGATKLMFVALCGERFGWDEGEGGNG